MLKQDRYDYIMKKVNSEGRAITTELQKELNVSEATIRKDLQDLAAKGLVKRVHGGILNRINDDLNFEVSSDLQVSIKEALARKAVELIVDKKVIFIDNGTTNLKFAEQLPLTYSGIIITNSPHISLVLCNHPNIQINLIGGELDKKTKAIKGSVTLSEVQKLNIECCILGIPCFNSEYGITVPSYEESLLKRQLITQSSCIISMVTKEKLERISTFYVDSINSINYLITETTADKRLIDLYRNKGIEILLI